MTEIIITKLIGGLGNQMYQYAAGRRLAHARNCPLLLDLSTYENRAKRNYGRRRFELDCFNIRADIATPSQLDAFRPRRQLRSGWTRTEPAGYRHVLERFLHFDPEILGLTGNVYLDGYWQSENYFKDIEDLLRGEFTLRPDPDPVTRELMRAIQSTDAVSLHVRRGDYVSDPIAREKHGPCSIDYYARAVGLITALVAAPHFYVFSDDPEWATDHIKPGFPTTYISHNGPARAHDDLRLMSSCKHHIIANSSFSWWGAWLNPRADKVVIAPANWFQERGRDASDMIPQGWIRV